MLARVEISQAQWTGVEYFRAHIFQFHKWIERCWEIDLPNFPIQVEDGVVTRSVGNEGGFSNRVINILREMMFHPPNYISILWAGLTMNRMSKGSNSHPVWCLESSLNDASSSKGNSQSTYERWTAGGRPKARLYSRRISISLLA